MKELVKKLSPDGSDRAFFRVKWQDKYAIKILPSKSQFGLKEAKAFYKIGRHLYKNAVAVPKILDFCEKTGEIIVEDLGDIKLHDVVVNYLSLKKYEKVTLIYKKVLDKLILMQINGAKDFNTSWCWQTPFYDSSLAKEKEVKYFLLAFIEGFTRSSYDIRVKEELFSLANLVDKLMNKEFFLHRDFQCRNIMLLEGEPYIIDFQGGRLGPLGYDLASILYDPYVNLTEDIRAECLNYYFTRLEKFVFPNIVKEAKNTFYILCTLRLLQALGAYGFLVKVKNKPFFKPYIKPALYSLKNQLYKVNNYLKVDTIQTIKLLDKIHDRLNLN